MPDVPGTVNYPTSLDSTVSLIKAANNAATTLSANTSSSDTTLTVASTTSFSDSGALSIEGEVIFYTGTTSTTFTGCVRGSDGTSASSHNSGTAVQGLIVAAHHNTLAEAIIATQTKVGSGSGTPGSGQVLQGTGSGTSGWSALPDATTSDAGLMAAADKTKLDAATSSATANTLVLRDANGRAQVAAPSAADDIATKEYVDDAVAAPQAFDTLSDGATVTWATGGGALSKAKVTLGGNRTLAITGAVNGSRGTLLVIQDGTGNRTLALPGSSKVVNGGAGAILLSQAANAIDMLSWEYDGTNYYWVFGPSFT